MTVEVEVDENPDGSGPIAEARARAGRPVLAWVVGLVFLALLVAVPYLLPRRVA